MTDFPENGWYAVAGADALRPGDVMPVWLFGQEFVAWRGQDGISQVWQNRCIHRGMRLQYGFVDGDRLACRYHGWRFGAGGQCKNFPAHPDMTPPDDYCIPSLPASEAGGLLWSTLGNATLGTSALDRLKGAIFCRTAAVNAPGAIVRAMFDSAEGETLMPGVWILRNIENPADDLIAAIQPVSSDRCQLHVLACSNNQNETAVRLGGAAWARRMRDFAEAKNQERRAA